MKSALVIIAVLVLLGVTYFAWLAYKSQQPSPSEFPAGLQNNQLSPCPESPNCINSEYAKDHEHYIAAISYHNRSVEDINQLLQQTIAISGGRITELNEFYIASIYTSRLFRFVDDVEFRIDPQQQLIHIRSASRQGHSDLGANRKRAQSIKQIFTQLSAQRDTESSSNQ
ncbi:MAG TPA: DUF1499 domain-containing protein [Gammaproteobacteria bacterium]